VGNIVIRGIRGATTVEFNTEEGIVSAVKELLLTIFDKNNVVKDDIAAIIFSSTRDITAAFPAKAARQLGLEYTALFGCSEMD
jgi:chorismate mutase